MPVIGDGAKTDGKSPAQASQDGQGGIDPISQTKAEHRYVYYRLYAKDGSLESHYPIYSNDRFISRISSKSVRPPHTAAALKRCLCRVEGFEASENSSLYLTLSETAPLNDSSRVSLRDNPGPGSSELIPVVLVVGLATAEKRSKAKSRADPKALLAWQAKQCYIYYRLYDEDIEAVSKTSFDENDLSLGRINTFSIPPPSTVACLKCCLVKAEAIPSHDVQLLENEDGEVIMNDRDSLALFNNEFPGFTEDQPIVLTYTRKLPSQTTAPQASFSNRLTITQSRAGSTMDPLPNQTTAPRASFSKRLTITQSWAGSTMDPTWHSITTGETFKTDGIHRTQPFTNNTSRSEAPCYVGINSSGKKAFVPAARCIMSPIQYDFLAKLLLIGDSYVGKSCLMNRFCEDAWTPSLPMTIGVEFKNRTIELDGERIRLQIWDTAGKERFKTVIASCYRGTMGILLVYDVTDKLSFNNIRMWHNHVEQHASEGVNKILIGNKSECTAKRVVTVEQGRELAKELGIRFVETSAKINEGVEEAFVTLAREIKRRLID